MHYGKKYSCPFNSKEKLEKIHIPLCLDNQNVIKIMPERGINDIVKFKDYHMQNKMILIKNLKKIILIFRLQYLNMIDFKS